MMRNAILMRFRRLQLWLALRVLSDRDVVYCWKVNQQGGQAVLDLAALNGQPQWRATRSALFMELAERSMIIRGELRRRGLI